MGFQAESAGVRYENYMASNIPKPTPDDYLIVEDNPLWLSTPSPFDTLDSEWYRIIIFYVFHVPVTGVSARAKPLDSYGWGSKSKNNDFKRLKKRLIKYSDITEEAFRCEDGWASLKQAFQATDLFVFPTNITRERVAYRKVKSGESDSLLSHIRNSFAHGRLSFYANGEDVYIAMEDIDNNKHVSARMIVSKRTLLYWKTIIEAGPFITEEELERTLGEAKNTSH